MSKANQKQQITEKDNESLDGVNVHELAAKYQSHPEAYIVLDHWYEETTIYICYHREETDEELEIRRKKENAAKKRKIQRIDQQKEKDVAEYNRIKELYGLT